MNTSSILLPETTVPKNQVDTMLASGGYVAHFDKDAQLVQQNLPVLGNLGMQQFVMIKGIVKRPLEHCKQILDLLKFGKVVVLGDSRGSTFEQMNDESVLFHALIPRPQLNESTDVLQKGKNWLRQAFAGWHHIYHEVFATAQVMAIQEL